MYWYHEEFLRPGDYFCLLKQRYSYWLSVPFPTATVLLNENLKQNRMSLFPCCKTVSIDGLQSISKHALQLHQHRPVVNNGSVQGIYGAFLLRTMIPQGRSISHLCKKAKSCSPISWNSRHNAPPLPGKQGSPLSQPVESRGLLSALLKNKRYNWHRFINRNWYMPGEFWYQMLQSWLVICMRKRRGVTLTVLNFQEMVGMGGYTCTYIVGIELET